MRDIPSEALDLITEPKEAGVRATFRKTLPVFQRFNMPFSGILFDDDTWMDTCAYGTGVLCVMNDNNSLRIQYAEDIHGTWPEWTNTSIALLAGSVPAVDNGYVWYQKSSGQVCYRHYATWGTENVVRSMPGACALAPLANRAWALWQRNTGSYEIVSMNSQESSHYVLYGLSSMPRVDVVSFGDKEYFYTMDRDAGRVIEIQHAGNSIAGKDSYGVGKPIIPIDAIDDVYGFKLSYASVIDNVVVVTGRLTRTSDDASVSFEAYATGPEFFSFGREMFIQGDVVAPGKMLRVGDYFVISSHYNYWIAKATSVFGGESHPDLEITTSDLASFSMTEAEGRSTNLDMDVSTALAHEAVAVGSDVELEMAYNNHWTKMTTCVVDVDSRTTDEQGQSRVLSGVGKSAKRLAQWSPDQGVWIPSQAKMYDFPANMTHVIRATGLWEKTDPEDPDTSIQLKDLNKLGVLYSTARASRGGAMQAKFYYPSDSYFKPYFGVAINYYRETAAEAAERLGVEMSELGDDMYGHNGFVAIYSLTEHNNSSGIALYLWKDSVLTKLTSVSMTLSANTWYWLQIEFVEGEIRVKYRADSLGSAWGEPIAFLYNQSTLPWKRETFGRGAIVVKNIVPSYSFLGGIGTEDTTLAVADNSSWPASGTLLIDNEQVAFSGKSANRTGPWGGVTVSYWPGYRLNASFGNGQGIPIPRANVADNYWTGLAISVIDGYGKGRTMRCLASDDYGINEWIPNEWVSGWSSFLGNTAYGQWYYNDQLGAIYANTDPGAVVWHGGEMNLGPYSSIAVSPAIYLTGRGANGTIAASHTGGTAYLYRDARVRVGMAGSFSQDEDQTIEEALKTIVGLAGGKATCQALVDENHSFATNRAQSVLSDHRNFVATLDLPAISSGHHVGIAFRGQSAFINDGGYPLADFNGSWYIAVERSGSYYYLSLYSRSASGNRTLFERIVIRQNNLNGASTPNVPVGTLKVSVQDNIFSVWLNGRYLHSFAWDSYPTGNYIAFFSSEGSTFKIHLSALDDLLSDIVVGTRGNGMSVLSELLADRHILWRDEPDGSMYFYRTREFAGILPDIISAVSDVKTESMVTRMRAEGLRISEVMDNELIRSHGNTFVTVNARHANSTEEARQEARLLIDEAWRDAEPKRYALVPHPGIQPGDACGFVENGGPVERIIRGQNIIIGFSGNNFIADMQCDVVPYERLW